MVATLARALACNSAVPQRLHHPPWHITVAGTQQTIRVDLGGARDQAALPEADRAKAGRLRAVIGTAPHVGTTPFALGKGVDLPGRRVPCVHNNFLKKSVSVGLSQGSRHRSRLVRGTKMGMRTAQQAGTAMGQAPVEPMAGRVSRTMPERTERIVSTRLCCLTGCGVGCGGWSCGAGHCSSGKERAWRSGCVARLCSGCSAPSAKHVRLAPVARVDASAFNGRTLGAFP